MLSDNSWNMSKQSPGASQAEWSGHYYEKEEESKKERNPYLSFVFFFFLSASITYLPKGVFQSGVFLTFSSHTLF